MKPRQIPGSVSSGFLGSGKTTILKALEAELYADHDEPFNGRRILVEGKSL